jgi:hypothetical protein
MASFGRTLLVALVSLAGLVSQASAQAYPVRPMPTSPPPTPVAELAAKAPSITIENGLVKARIYTPDAQKGLYIGTRFDWAGVIGSLNYKGHEFHGSWVDQQTSDPVVTGSFVFTGEGASQQIVVSQGEGIATGPIEEFYDEKEQPLGFDMAKPGGTFVKIGVGVLRRPDDKPYNHFRLYPLVDEGKRTLTTKKDSATFTQVVTDPATGYGYSYSKTVRLVPGKPQLLIEHRLRNTGAKPISTMVFPHNFLKLSPGNENVQVTVPFKVVSEPPPSAEYIKIDGNKVSYVKPLTNTMRASVPMAGYGPTAKDNAAEIIDTKTGYGMSFKGDLPLSEMHIWSIRTVMGLVPLTDLGTIAPGAEKRWVYNYTYIAR